MQKIFLSPDSHLLHLMNLRHHFSFKRFLSKNSSETERLFLGFLSTCNLQVITLYCKVLADRTTETDRHRYVHTKLKRTLPERIWEIKLKLEITEL